LKQEFEKKEHDRFMTQEKKKQQQPQTQPVTPAKPKQDAPLTELTDSDLEQVVGGQQTQFSLNFTKVE
jgi:hypothetical protein